MMVRITANSSFQNLRPSTLRDHLFLINSLLYFFQSLLQIFITLLKKTPLNICLHNFLLAFYYIKKE